MTTTSHALVLNADWTPHDVVPWEAAWSMLDRGVAYMLKAYEGRFIRSMRQAWEWPAVIVLKQLAAKKNIRCTRENLFARDNYTCQYCGCQPRTATGRPDLDALTFDHVIPRAQSKDGVSVTLRTGERVALTGWQNIVTACRPCNATKADRTPAQAKMTLRTEPRRPTPIETLMINMRKIKIPDEWKEVLPADSPWRTYWETELEP